MRKGRLGGSASVEAAMFLPVLLLFVLGIMERGILLHGALSLKTVQEEGFARARMLFREGESLEKASQEALSLQEGGRAEGGIAWESSIENSSLLDFRALTLSTQYSAGALFPSSGKILGRETVENPAAFRNHMDFLWEKGEEWSQRWSE